MSNLIFLSVFLLAILEQENFVLGAPSNNFLSSKVSSNLQLRLENDGSADIFVRLASGTTTVIQQVIEGRYASRTDRLDSLHKVLQDFSAKSQKNLLDFLNSRPTSSPTTFKSFWVTNQIFIKDADTSLVQKILESFSDEIESIYMNEVVAWIETPIELKNASSKTSEEFHWGLRKIQAPEAWRELGFRGNEMSPSQVNSEVRIATLDTGVRGTHEALRDNFLGEYGWFDPTFGELVPGDRMGHGTHTTATIAGTNGIGVAPWAKWMSCRACPTMGCNMHDLIACGQFFVCPTLSDGTAPDCSKAPHLVSNSWSGGQGQIWFSEVIEAWHAAGIIPIFSIGNFGNAFCGSANSPGDSERVIGVGSTTEEDSLSWFSSIGPTVAGLLKPDVVAPGSDILSAYHTADDAYSLMSGTSMSAPHVSAIAAILKTRNPDMTFDEVRRAIVSTAEHDLQQRNMNCQGIPDNQYPNHVYGYGRVNALKSLLNASQLSKSS